MKKTYFVLGMLIMLLIVTGCQTKSNTITDVTTKDTIVCNTPYIRVGTNCCLDKDNNKICDKDESENLMQKEIPKETKKLSTWSLTRFEPDSATSGDGNYFRFRNEISKDYFYRAKLIIDSDTYILYDGGSRCGVNLCFSYSCRPGSFLEDKYIGEHIVQIKAFYCSLSNCQQMNINNWEEQQFTAEGIQKEDFSQLPSSPLQLVSVQK